MAERRMFTKQVTDSDSFIEMSSAAQALYFHLNQGADDDGFNNQIQTAMLKAHAGTDDLKILMAKNFVIRFESGVIVIKHWRMHNTLRKDRYKPTSYQEELSLLGIKDNGAYSFDRLPNGCQMVAKRLPQGSIDEYSIIKDSSVECKGTAPAHTHAHEDTPAPTAEDVIHAYNDACVCLPPLRYITDIERSAAEAILQNHTLDQLKEAFSRAEASDLLTARKEGARWRADFMWIVKEDRIKDILNGKYDSWYKTPAKPTPATDSNSTFDVDEFYERSVGHTYGKEVV